MSDYVKLDKDMLYMIGCLVIELDNYERVKEDLIAATSGQDIVDSLSDTCACPYHMFGEKVAEFLTASALELSDVDNLAELVGNIAADPKQVLSADLLDYIHERQARQQEAIAINKLNSLADDAPFN